MGSHASVTRTVEVGCEEPNPGGTYGGNRVQCSTVNKTRLNCIPPLLCISFEFICIFSSLRLQEWGCYRHTFTVTV